MSEAKKCGFIGKLFKLVIWGVVGFLFFAVLLAATLPLWISPVATGVAGKVVPGYTGTDFRIDRFCLNPYTGVLAISGVKLSNPDGFGDAAAFSLSSFNLEMSVGSLFSDTIIVREIAIEDAFVSYYSNNGKNNFDVILANVDKAMGPKEEKEGAKDADEKSASSKKKVIIDHLRVAGTKVKLMKSDMMPAMLLPAIELTDIGKKSNGATFEDVFKQISEAVMKSMASIGDGIGALGGILGGGAKDISGLINSGAKDLSKAFDDVSGNDVSGNKVGAALSGLAGSAKDAYTGVSGAAKGTVDAVGDTTKKAAEGVKNLFKGFGK